MNDARAAHGLAPLTVDGSILGIALRWTDTMARHQDLARNPAYAQQIFDVQPAALTVGEDVGRGTGTDRGLFDAFMASSGHRTKILGSQFSHVATACGIDSGGRLWVAQNFWG